MQIDNTDPRVPLVIFDNPNEAVEFAIKLLGLVKSPRTNVVNMSAAVQLNKTDTGWAPGSIKAVINQ